MAAAGVLTHRDKKAGRALAIVVCGLWQKRAASTTVFFAIRVKTANTKRRRWTGSVCSKRDLESQCACAANRIELRMKSDLRVLANSIKHTVKGDVLILCGPIFPRFSSKRLVHNRRAIGEQCRGGPSLAKAPARFCHSYLPTRKACQNVRLRGNGSASNVGLRFSVSRFQRTRTTPKGSWF